ncbi:MAG: hypothetical protein HY840_12330 [Bacteroidetes bacterium]|nr:hypothetical protein [Bacteroidota bacterium]
MQAGTNYIYILLTVAYVIYSIIKAGKKVTQNRPTIDPQPQSPLPVHPPVEKQAPQQDFTKMLEEILGGGAPEEKIPEPQVIQPKPQPVAIKLQPTKIVTHSEKKEKITPSHLHPKNQKEEIKYQKATAKKVVAESVAVEEPEFNFDIREAIVYSEILKRPNW